MNIYTLKNLELIKLAHKFNKTAFGRRACLFALIPAFLSIGYYISFIVADEISDKQWICFILSLVGTCIAQLMYGNMLKDYINSKKDN